MDSEKTSEDDVSDAQDVKLFLMLCTPVYCIFGFFFTLIIPKYFLQISSQIISWRSWLMILLCACIPISMLVSVIMMWLRYNRRKYNRALFYCAMPLILYFIEKELERF